MTDHSKIIYLIEDASPFWAEIKERLRGVNAAYFPLPEDTDLKTLLNFKPALTMLSAPTYNVLAPMPREMQKLIVNKDCSPGMVYPIGDGRSAVLIGWPMEDVPFFELTSRMLSVARRRFFKTLIRIKPKEEKMAVMGESEDFSLTGLAFRASRPFHRGEEMTISFSVPMVKKTAEMEAQIVRSIQVPEDESTHYGARFTNMDPPTRQILEDFVHSI